MLRYLVKLIKSSEAAEGTLAFEFARPPDFNYVAGQFVMLKHKKVVGPGIFDNRHDYSLTSAPYETNLKITTRMRSSIFKNALKKLPPGGEMIIEGPYGHFTLHEDTSIAAVFLAGGIGITPVRSMVLQSLHDQTGHDLNVFYSNRRPEDAAFLDELQQRTGDKFKLIATMTDMENSKEPWSGETGFITIDMIKNHLGDITKPIYYMVGPPQFVEAMRETLRAAQIVENKIRWENFTGY